MALGRSVLSRIAGFFRKLGRLLVLGTRNGDLPVFLLFLVISFFFWMSQNMGEMYERSISYPVELTGLDENMRLTHDVSSPLRITVSGPGTAIWSASRKRKTIMLNAAGFASSTPNMYAKASSELVDSMASLLPASLTIKSIYPDSLRFGCIEEVRVKLPVRFTGEASGGDRYIIDRLECIPDSVTLGVPAGKDTLYGQILTESVDIQATSEVNEVEAGLVLPADVRLLDNDFVRVVSYSSRVTEKSLDVPVEGVNFPDGLLLKTFPSKVRVSFRVRLADFDSAGPEDFRVAVDYSTLNTSDAKAEVIVINQPADVENVRVSPMLVEYLVEKTGFWR